MSFRIISERVLRSVTDHITRTNTDDAGVTTTTTETITKFVEDIVRRIVPDPEAAKQVVEAVRERLEASDVDPHDDRPAVVALVADVLRDQRRQPCASCPPASSLEEEHRLFLPLVVATRPEPVFSVDARTGRLVIDTSDLGNTVDVTRDGSGVRIAIDGRTFTFDESQASRLSIRTNGGDDVVSVAANVNHDIRIYGGDGDDTITGGAGADYIDGGAGDDVIEGGNGVDALFGGDGADTLRGGSSRDYLDGGAGDDVLEGGPSADALFGGEGDDELNGGTSNDVLAGGSGADRYVNTHGTDTAYYEPGEDFDEGAYDLQSVVMTNPAGYVPGAAAIRIDGDAEFVARVESDLEALRSTPLGRALLGDLDTSGFTVTVRLSDDDLNRVAPLDPTDARYADQPMLVAGTGSDGDLSYAFDNAVLGRGSGWRDRPPIVGLYHELVHAYHFATGTRMRDSDGGTSLEQLQTIGYPVDHDEDPSTPDVSVSPYSDNEFRALLGVPTRPSP